MEFLAKKSGVPAGTTTALTTKQRGDAAEGASLRHLQAAGLTLLERNYRTPGRGGGEIDLILREPDGTLVFVEVRARADHSHGGAAASVGATKRRRIVRAAQHYLLRQRAPPPLPQISTLPPPVTLASSACTPSAMGRAEACAHWYCRSALSMNCC